MACITAFVTTVILQGCGGGGAGTSSGGSGSSSSSGGSAAAQIVGVSGNRMTLNGSPWLPRGLNLPMPKGRGF